MRLLRSLCSPLNDAENSRIPYIDPRVKPEDDKRLRNSRIIVIASEAKQSLGILNSFLGILEFSVGILEFFFSSLLEILDFCSL